MTDTLSYYAKAFSLLLRGARYARRGFFGTAQIILQGECRLHWLRDSLVAKLAERAQ